MRYIVFSVLFLGCRANVPEDPSYLQEEIEFQREFELEQRKQELTKKLVLIRNEAHWEWSLEKLRNSELEFQKEFELEQKKKELTRKLEDSVKQKD